MTLRKDVTITEQQTGPIDFALLSDVDGDGVPETGIDLSAVDHVELWLKNNSGGTAMATSSGGDLSFPAGYAAAGSIRWTPGTSDLQASLSPYQYQFKVFDTATSWYYVPE